MFTISGLWLYNHQEHQIDDTYNNIRCMTHTKLSSQLYCYLPLAQMFDRGNFLTNLKIFAANVLHLNKRILSVSACNIYGSHESAYCIISINVSDKARMSLLEAYSK